MAPRATRAQLLAALLCAVVGFALVVQVTQARSDGLTGLRQSDLVRLLDEVTQRSESLEDEKTDLESQVALLEESSTSEQAALDAAKRAAATQGILSGRLPAEGPGIRLSIAGNVSAAAMLNLLEELRNAGAEALQVGGQRIVVSSSFSDSDDGLVLDGSVLEPPYVWLAIGDPKTLQPALEIPGGALATLRNAGAEATVVQLDEVEVSAVRSPSAPRYATPATGTDGDG